MEVDDALVRLGKFGKWQVILYITISICTTFPSSWHMLAIVFLGGIPEHRCKLPNGFTEMDIPEELENGQIKNSSCHLYSNRTYSNETQACPVGYEYMGDYGPTIASEWDLVCEKLYLKDMTQTVMVIGVMFGAMVFSFLSDSIGRKPVFLFSNWMMVVIGLITAFTHNYYFFTAMRFLAGMLQQGIMLTGFVLACELFPAKYRTFAGTAIENFWAVGMCILALLAYLIRNWRYFQLIITLPGLLTISLFWCLPESIPWLVANNRHTDAEHILRKAAKINNVDMPERILAHTEGEITLDGKENKTLKEKSSFTVKARNSWNMLCISIRNLFKRNRREENTAKYTLLDVFRHKKLAMYAIIMAFLWFVNSLVYYGLSLSTGLTAGDRYLNFFLSGLVEIPAYTSTIFVLAKWGRRWPLCIFHIVAGVALLCSLCIPNKTEGGVSLLPLIITFNMIGKFGITGSFGTVFLYAPEIFPTTLRNQMIGFSSVGGRLGNMLAPFASYIGSIMPMLPGILFGSLSVGMGLLALLLPETLGRPLPQTIEDIDRWSNTPKRQDNESKNHEVEKITNDINLLKEEL